MTNSHGRQGAPEAEHREKGSLLGNDRQIACVHNLEGCGPNEIDACAGKAKRSNARSKQKLIA